MVQHTEDLVKKTAEDVLKFRMLSSSQVEQIHLNALRIVEEIGVEFHNEQAVAILGRAGARIDGSRVRLPRQMVYAALEVSPRRVEMYARDRSLRMVLDGTNTYYGTYGTAPFAIDPYTGERKPSTRETIGLAARVCDFLPQIDWAMVLGVPSDCPPPIADRVGFRAAVANLTKPMYSSAYTVAGMADIVEMCEIIAGGAEQLRTRPFFTTGIDPSSPLLYGDETAGKLILMAQKGLPIIFNPMTQAAATGPATLAGTLSLALAEDLAGVALVQAVRPGSPMIVGGGISTMDLRSMVFGYGAPEMAMLSAAWTEIIRGYYNLPTYGSGGASNAKTVDEQSAIEAGMSLMMSAVARPDISHALGTIDTGMSISMEQLALCDEAIAIARHMVQGFAVTEETLAFDVIAAVGPGGNFLAEEHTYHHFREHYRSNLLDRLRYEAWKEKGRRTMGQRLNEQVRHILATHTPSPLPEEVLRCLDEVVNRAERRLD
ncbi:MAG: trimethylamine methyltransferase family protein [Chloroflexi bacterium]|nr:trimethylamine methyltransferase family protein [Chloroflexota bacterium]